MYRIGMWVAKIKMNGEKALFGSRTKAFGISLSGYPVSVFERADGIYVYVVCFVFGGSRNIREFVHDLKRDRRVINLEQQGNFLIGQIREPRDFGPIYNSKIIYLEPAIITDRGEEFFTLGSWDKKELATFVNLVETTHQGELLSIRQEKINSVSIVSIQPELTTQQRKAMEIAVQHGYYHYPRKTDLERLAKLMNVSYSTYQAHLRKAEKKLLPFAFSRAYAD